ncbi:MAG TPA: Gfo/Idh/MocA family oxidoreductase, partial [Tepidisphaeraceae bacterium]|nr:Gfo/Idh/MocA family oxidoreductase [Tepidisphaeraceae bacterium]
MNDGRFSRRTFIRGSTSVGVGLAVASHLHGETTSQKDKPIRWGLIGCGHRAHAAHLAAMQSFPDDMEILGLCDISDDRLASAMKKVKSADSVERYTDYHKLLANPQLNAVMIATPNLLHSEMAIAALEAGKHVMCEKPMAASIEQCRAMNDAAEKHPDQAVLYTMQLRYSPMYEVMRKQIEAGRIGQPKNITFLESRGDWNDSPGIWKYTDPKTGKAMNWRFSHTASGGTLSEKVCHYFDIINWM